MHTAWASMLFVRIYRQCESLYQRNSNIAVPLFVCVCIQDCPESVPTLSRLDSLSLSVGLCSPHAFPVQRQKSIVFSISRQSDLDKKIK